MAPRNGVFSPFAVAMQRGGAVCALALPSEVWIEVLSRLNGQDLARALCTCKAFSRLQQPVWQAACFKRWNKWSSYLDPASHWRRQYELLCLRELAEQTVADVGQIRNAQQFVSDRHRAVLVEWMCEVRGSAGRSECAMPTGVDNAACRCSVPDPPRPCAP